MSWVAVALLMWNTARRSSHYSPSLHILIFFNLEESLLFHHGFVSNHEF
jgi:hypothetical protein